MTTTLCSMLRQLLTAALLCCAAVIWASDTAKGGPPRHGGQVAEAGQLEWELVVRRDRLVIHVRDEAKPASTARSTGNLKRGDNTREATLRPAGSDRLEAVGPFQLTHGTKVEATIQRPGAREVVLRYTLR